MAIGYEAPLDGQDGINHIGGLGVGALHLGHTPAKTFCWRKEQSVTHSVSVVFLFSSLSFFLCTSSAKLHLTHSSFISLRKMHCDWTLLLWKLCGSVWINQGEEFMRHFDRVV